MVSVAIPQPSLDVAVGDVDRDLAAAFDRIARIDGQVDQHPLQLCGVRGDVPDVIGDVHTDLDRARNDRAQHSLHVAEDRLRVDTLDGDRSAAREGEQPARELHAMAARGLEIAQPLAEPSIPGHRGTQQARVSEDHHQMIVEVVGDASRQGPEGLELLGLPQLVFQASLLGDVAGDPHPSQGFSGFRSDRTREEQQESIAGLVQVEREILDDEVGVAAKLRDLGREVLWISQDRGAEPEEVRHRTPHPGVLSSRAGEIAERAIDQHDEALAVLNEDAQGGRIHDGAQRPPLRRQGRGLSPAVFGGLHALQAEG
jgi:hypothetical protein